VLNIINSASLCSSRSLSGFEQFSYIGQGRKKRGSMVHCVPIRRKLCLASKSANLKERSTSTSFWLCKSVGSRTFILLSMYRLCSFIS
jgi:hypothetical protein